MKRSRPKNTSELVSLLASEKQPRVLSLDTAKVSPRPQARVDFGDIDSLAESIKSRGQDNPISVRKSLPSDNVETPYIILTGERRWRACRQLGIPVEAIDKDLTTNKLDTVLEAVENFQRKDLTPFETAALIHNLLGEGLKKGEVAKLLGRSNQFISTHYKLLNPKPEILQVFKDGHTSDPEALAALGEIFEVDSFVAQQIIIEAENTGISRQHLRSTLKKLKDGPDCFSDDSGGQSPTTSSKSETLVANHTEQGEQNQDTFPHAEKTTGDKDETEESVTTKHFPPTTTDSSQKASISAPNTKHQTEPNASAGNEVKVMVMVGQADAYLAELLIESAPENKVKVRTSNGQQLEVDAEDVSIHKVG